MPFNQTHPISFISESIYRFVITQSSLSAAEMYWCDLEQIENKIEALIDLGLYYTCHHTSQGSKYSLVHIMAIICLIAAGYFVEHFCTVFIVYKMFNCIYRQTILLLWTVLRSCALALVILKLEMSWSADAARAVFQERICPISCLW